MTQQSGHPKIVNLSGGLYRSATPTQIPEISMSDMKNFDIEDQGIVTRRGLKRDNSSPFHPGCLQFGYSDTLRPHYLKQSGGDWGPQTPLATTQSKWGMWFYAKEGTATTAQRHLFNFQDSSGNPLIELYFGTDSRLHCNLRPNSTESLQDVAEGAGGEQVLRTATTHLYGVSLICDVANTIEVSLYDWSGVKVSASKNYSSSTWSTADTLVVGCDENTDYPDSDWTNASNYAYYGYLGEALIVRDRPTDITTNFNSMHREPGARVPDSQRVAYYPFQKNTDDAWGKNPSFPTNMWRTGGGNSYYSVKDSLSYTSTSESRDLLHCPKSWHIDTYGVNSHIAGKTQSLSSRYRTYNNGVGSKYTWTFDVLPIKMDTGTYTLLAATTAGPYIKLSKSTAGETTVEYGHVFNSSNDISITHTINNNYASKISCQYGHSGASATTVGLRMFQDTMRVSSTEHTLVSSTAPTTVGNLFLGTANVTSVSSEAFVSGLVFHNTNAGDDWGDKPQESIENVTTYTNVIRRHGGLEGQLADLGIGRTIRVASGTKMERTGDSNQSFSMFDLPKFSNVKAAYLFTEVTGYDHASASTPHGVLKNIFSTSSTDNTDFVMTNNSSPIWVADRYNDAGLATTDHLDLIYEDTADGILPFKPVNDNLGSRIFVTRNSKIIDRNGNSFALGDTYKYNDRISGKVRGFMYGNSMYFHNEDYYLRFNGNEIRPVEPITPSIPITLSKDSSPSSGLNGTYKYAYTYVDRAGIESYPSLPTATTVKTGSISVSLDPAISDSSYLNKHVQYVNIYRNKGGTTSTTSLSRDADKSLYLLKQIPLSAVKNLSGSTLFTDTTADAALGPNPPEPEMADPVPPCKYSAVHSDTIIFTGNKLAPNHFYQSAGQTPELLGLPGVDEFLTEDGDHNTGVASLGGGFIVFKKNSRLFIRGGIGGEKYEYGNGGCMAHDTLVTIGPRVMGLGASGFFITDGHNYDDITEIRQDGRTVSSIAFDVATWSDAVKEAATAEYHAPTERYICHVNDKYYIYDKRYRVWTKYDDMVGVPFANDNNFYMFSRGWLLKEDSDISYVGTTVQRHSISSGSVGKIQVVSTTSIPATSAYGMPLYVGTTHYRVTSISATGTTHDIFVSTTKNFTNASDMSFGVMNAYADTKFFQMRTPNRNKMFKRFLCEHGNTAGGELEIRVARNQADFDRGYSHYVADTDIEKINTVLRARSENLAIEMAAEDGKKHKIRNYSMVYEQDSIE